MKARLAIWLLLELLVAASLSLSTCILRRDHTKAWSAWHNHPTPETRRDLDRQDTLDYWSHVTFALMLFGAMAAVTVPIIVVVTRHGWRDMKGAKIARMLLP